MIYMVASKRDSVVRISACFYLAMKEDNFLKTCYSMGRKVNFTLSKTYFTCEVDFLSKII